MNGEKNSTSGKQNPTFVSSKVEPTNPSRRSLISSLLGIAGAGGAISLSGCDQQTAQQMLGDEPRYLLDTNPNRNYGAWTFGSVSQMRSRSGVYDGALAMLAGYYEPDDGGGGAFYFDTQSIARQDNGTVIDGIGGKWIRAFSGPINVRWFGACAELSPPDANGNESSDYMGIQAALNWCDYNSGGVIDVPIGIYRVTKTLIIYENTTLEMNSGTTIRREFNDNGAKALMYASGNRPFNITIRGGTLDGNGRKFRLNGFNIFGGRGFRNLLVENTQFLDVVDCHSIDLAASEDVIIRGCKFSGYTDLAERHFSESIQIDPDLTPEEPVSGRKYGSTSKRILIEGCYFGPDREAGFNAPACGVGNHAAFVESAGRFNEDIKVVNSVFDGCSYAAVHPFNFDNTTISGNSFLNCNRGVLVDASNTHRESGSGLTISSNEFKNCSGHSIEFRQNKRWETEGSKHKNIVISNNVFSESPAGSAIALVWCDNIVISGNTTERCRNFVRMNCSSRVNINGNTCGSTLSTGVWMYVDTVGSNRGWSVRDVIISSNVFWGLRHRGIHVNGSCARVNILNNLITNPDQENAGRPGIGVDGGGNNGHCEDIRISGNTIQFDSGAGRNVTAAIVALSSVSDLYLSHNHCSSGPELYDNRSV